MIILKPNRSCQTYFCKRFNNTMPYELSNLLDKNVWNKFIDKLNNIMKTSKSSNLIVDLKKEISRYNNFYFCNSIEIIVNPKNKKSFHLIIYTNKMFMIL